jgi:GPI ethanolamine phosphate transferase 1
VIGCLVLSTFTLLPVIKVENANTITIGGLLMLGSGVVYLIFQKSITSRSRSRGANSGFDYLSRSIMGAQVGIILLAILVTRSSIASLQAKQGLPLGNQVTGWLVLITSLGLPFAHRTRPNNHYFHRLLIIFLAFSPSFVLLTISYEGLFYFAFCTTLMTWVRLEHSIYVFNQSASESSASAISATSASPASVHRTLTLSDARVALFFLFLLQSAFFSTGNIASISSFSLDAVYRLIPIFDPFAQGALLLFKILVPFAIISANLGILNRRLGVAPSALFMLVMAVSDVMTLNFFWMVKDEGSWLDIGTTISHFVIGSLLCVFVAGLEFLSEVLISGVEVDMRDAQQVGGAEPEDLALELDARTSSAPEDRQAEKPQKLANGHSTPNGVAVPA